MRRQRRRLLQKQQIALKTSVVILNWNGRDFLEKFLPSVCASVSGMDAEVVIADNASTDDSLNYLDKNWSELKVIRFQKNYGYTGGYNRALAQLDSEYFVLMNSDIEPDPNWLCALEEWMDLHPDCAACGPKLRSYTEREKFEYAGAAGGMMDSLGYPYCRGRVMSRVEYDDGQYDSPSEVFWMSGACLMVRSSVWKELKGLDERLFAHQEEIDFCWRARLAGWKICYVPRSVVFHVGGGTLPMNSPYKVELNYRNNLLILYKNLPLTYSYRNFYKVMSMLVPDDEFPNGMDSIMETWLFDFVNEERKEFLENCVANACHVTRRNIFFRMCLDGLSALVYLLQFKPAYFKAVIRAHKQFRAMRAMPGEKKLLAALRDDLSKNGNRVALNMLDIDLSRPRTKRVAIRGMQTSSIVLLSMSYRDEVFDYVEK